MVSSPIKAKKHMFQEIFDRVAAIGNPPTSMILDFEIAALNHFLKCFQILAFKQQYNI